MFAFTKISCVTTESIRSRLCFKLVIPCRIIFRFGSYSKLFTWFWITIKVNFDTIDTWNLIRYFKFDIGTWWKIHLIIIGIFMCTFNSCNIFIFNYYFRIFLCSNNFKIIPCWRFVIRWKIIKFSAVFVANSFNSVKSPILGFIANIICCCCIKIKFCSICTVFWWKYKFSLIFCYILRFKLIFTVIQSYWASSRWSNFIARIIFIRIFCCYCNFNLIIMINTKSQKWK